MTRSNTSTSAISTMKGTLLRRLMLLPEEQHVADHGDAGEDGQHRGVPAQPVAGEAVVDAHHTMLATRAAARTGQALEVALVDHVDVGG